MIIERIDMYILYGKLVKKILRFFILIVLRSMCLLDDLIGFFFILKLIFHIKFVL